MGFGGRGVSASGLELGSLGVAVELLGVLYSGLQDAGERMGQLQVQVVGRGEREQSLQRAENRIEAAPGRQERGDFGERAEEIGERVEEVVGQRAVEVVGHEGLEYLHRAAIHSRTRGLVLIDHVTTEQCVKDVQAQMILRALGNCLNDLWANAP